MTTSTSSASTKRADAARNVERILDAAITCLTERPDATMIDIARQAGLGRPTLYGHFASRPDLLDAVVARLVERAEHTLATVDVDGDPWDALVRLIHGSWRQMDQSRAVIAAAHTELPPARIRQLHDAPAARVDALIERGRARGRFRTDLPTSWLVTMLHQTFNAAATEITDGHLDPASAPDRIVATVSALFGADAAERPVATRRAGGERPRAR